MADLKKDVIGKVYDSVPGPVEDYLKTTVEEIKKVVSTSNKKLTKAINTINKYNSNGRLPLHESVVIGLVPKFVTLLPNYAIGNGKGDLKPTFLDNCNTGTISYVPSGTIDTITPLPYIFDSEEDFSKYLKLAIKESFYSLFAKVESVFRKYVNVEEYYYPILVGDTIWTYFQDRFGYTHYLIFTGDNGSGKNSALLVFKYLGYRVFYVVSATAANYWTALGTEEEGQVCIAEDEVEDLTRDIDKRNILKAGYASGVSVPRTEMEGGRRNDNLLVYCHKWLATEEWKEDKYTKGILHRSLKLKFLVGDVSYNIKDVLRFADDPEYKPLYDELTELRKLLFCFRLLHYKDPILNVKLNVKGRTAELVSPLIRLFQDSPAAKERILESLSIFMQERNESMLDSFEAKLRESVQSLINDRITRTLQPTEEDKVLGPHTFTNESIKERLVRDTEAREDPEKNGMYYSSSIGAFSQSKISSILKSKFKARLSIWKKIDGKSYRCVEFNQDYLNRIKASYEVPEKIQILPAVTPVTPVTAISSKDDRDKLTETDSEQSREFKQCEKSNPECNIYNTDSNKEHLRTDTFFHEA